MRNLKRVAYAVCGLVSTLAILGFVLENQQSVSLLFFGWVGPELPVSLLMILALLIGMVIGPILGWFFRGRAKVLHKRAI